MSGVRILSRTLITQREPGRAPFVLGARRMTRTRGFGLRFAPVGANRAPLALSALSRTPGRRKADVHWTSCALSRTGYELCSGRRKALSLHRAVFQQRQRFTAESTGQGDDIFSSCPADVFLPLLILLNRSDRNISKLCKLRLA